MATLSLKGSTFFIHPVHKYGISQYLNKAMHISEFKAQFYTPGGIMKAQRTRSCQVDQTTVQGFAPKSTVRNQLFT